MGTNAALGTDAAADEAGAQLARLIAEQEAEFFSRQPRSAEMHERAVEHLAGGATSNWMIARPATMWISHGKGSQIYDVDGTEYVDLHAGYGAMARRPRPPGDRGGGVRTRVASRYPLRPAHRGRDRRGRGAGAIASGCPSGASATRAPRRRWTPSTSCGPSPAAT